MNQPMTEKNGEKPCLSGRQARILVAPLDWGLGHATRCIPLIRELLVQGCEVWFAGEGAQESLLKAEFPAIPFLKLEGYRVKYARSQAGMLLGMIKQSAKITKAIKQEHKWLQQAVKDYGFDAVISDNRYGLYHSSIPSVFITHQLTIKSPFGKWSENLLRKKNYSYINRFTSCWIPDREEDNNLAGELSHPLMKPTIPVQYIGPLSRFNKMNTPVIDKHLLIILSGPEPQRTILENKIIHEISNYAGTATVVRGLPGSANLIPSTNMIRFYNHLPAEQLNEEMHKAAYIIARSGYSTVMDIATLQQKSILIPTPGQTEQEYLAKYLALKNFAPWVSQKKFSLQTALSKTEGFLYNFPPQNNNNTLAPVLTAFIASLKVS